MPEKQKTDVSSVQNKGGLAKKAKRYLLLSRMATKVFKINLSNNKFIRQVDAHKPLFPK